MDFTDDDTGRPWRILEQIVEDPASGLTFQFEVAPDGSCHFRVFGNLPFGNREFIFENGAFAAAGCVLNCRTKPTWKVPVDI